MSFLTGLALRRRPVTILTMVLVLVIGVFTYNNFQRELFPEIEFPNITIVTLYTNANPKAVERDVTKPIEDAISGLDGVKEIQSTSSESVSLVLVTFEFGEDLEEAERTIESNINGVSFPDGVEDPFVSRINSDTFPVLQLTVIGDRDIPSLQRVVDDLILPSIERVDGVFRVDVVGKVDEQVQVTVDIDRLDDLGVSILQVASAIRENNTSFPAGDVNTRGSSFAVRTAHEFGSLGDIRKLGIGFERSPVTGALVKDRPIFLSDVAEVGVGSAKATSISRTNGKPSLSLLVLKDPDGNTVEVTENVLNALNDVEGLPDDVSVLILSNDGPEVQRQLDSLLRDGSLGFVFAIMVVFAFLVNFRPSLLRGAALAIRPTIIIGLSIPLSVLTGILFLGFTDLTLNVMTLAGLAIAVGRVVDDSIVVLENTYRHIQRGEEGLQAAFDATKEVGAAIVSSTLTTIVVFVPLAFIQGLVGSFFSPFAISVSFALIGSTLVALTAVPVLGAILLRRGDFSGSVEDDDLGIENTFIQRTYMPLLKWALRHKAYTLLISAAVTLASLGLVFVIPVTLFPSAEPEFLTIDLELPTGTSVARTFEEVVNIEDVLADLERLGIVEVYQVTIGGASDQFGPGGGTGGMNIAGFFVKLNKELSEGAADTLRARLPGNDEFTITVAELTNGPPTGDLELNISGNNFSDIAMVADQLEQELASIDGIINLTSDVSDAKDEVVINVNPTKAAEFGLTTATIGFQVNQFIVGRTVSEIDLENSTLDIVVRGRPENVDDIEELKNLSIEGPFGLVKLGSIADIVIEKGPVTISRFDNERSASISGTITAEDTQAIGRLVQQKIDGLGAPPGVNINSGGIFEQIAEGFEDVSKAMAVGVVLVYLVMVASLGSLRNPFIIVLSLPLAIVGALVALVVTDRTLSLSAMMGFLLLIGVVVTNAIVLLTFVEQLRERGLNVYDALIEGGRIRLRPILMTAFTTTFALLPLAVSGGSDNGIIGPELATVVIGGLASSTFLTLVAVPVIYTIMNESIPGMFRKLGSGASRTESFDATLSSGQPADD